MNNKLNNKKGEKICIVSFPFLNTHELLMCKVLNVSF